jgi:GNAT superfamily N-acetyltransferase
MTPADVPAGLSLCRAARWNQTAADWDFFLSFAPGGALAAEEHGRVIGTVATVPYGQFTWISMVLVDPAARGRGVGRLLLERGLALVPENVTARLDATPAGEPLYRTLGFEPEHRLARWFVTGGRVADREIKTADKGPSYTTHKGPSYTAHEGPLDTRRLTANDWAQILPMDLHVFGASRKALLQRMAAEAPEYAWVLDAGGRIRAYLFGRHGQVREQLGPLVADTRESAQGLLQSCLVAHPDRTFFTDAPDRDDGWREVLAGLGFAVERPFLRMHRGRLTAPGDLRTVYAVTGPEFG